MAIMFFCISLVPPAILTPMLSRYICLMPPSSAAYLESAANWPVRPMTCMPISLNRLSIAGAVDLGDGAGVVRGMALGREPGDPVAEHTRDLDVDGRVGELVPDTGVVYQP